MNSDANNKKRSDPIKDQSQINTFTPDKEKKGEKSRAEAKIGLQKEIEIAKKLLIEGQISKSNEIAFKALLEYKEALGGENSILLLPGYFILAEANIQDGKLKRAEEFLVAAYWNFLKSSKEEKGENQDATRNAMMNDISEDEIISYRGTLHKTFSKLFLAQKDYVRALDELKNGIYMDSVKYGPEHPITATNYFHMGNIFIQKKGIAEAEAFFGKYSEIWYKFLKTYFRHNEDISGNFALPVDEIILKEALYMLKQIEKFFEHAPKNTNSINFRFRERNFQALSLIYRLTKDDHMYREYLQRVHDDYEREYGDSIRKVGKLKLLLNDMNMTLD